MPCNNATIIWEDNQPLTLINILTEGHIAECANHISVPIAICHREIELSNIVPQKIPGIFNKVLADEAKDPIISWTHVKKQRLARYLANKALQDDVRETSYKKI